MFDTWVGAKSMEHLTYFIVNFEWLLVLCVSSLSMKNLNFQQYLYFSPEIYFIHYLEIEIETGSIFQIIDFTSFMQKMGYILAFQWVII